MATHFSNLAWKISWTEEPSRLQSKGLQRDTTEGLSTPEAEDQEMADLEEVFVTHGPLLAKALSWSAHPTVFSVTHFMRTYWLAP